MAWAKIANRATGETSWVDGHAARCARVRRRVLAWANHVAQDYQDVPHQTVMVTLTYRPGVDWRPGHIRDFMYWLRGQWSLLAYCWVAELQSRGAVHYHVLGVVSTPYRRIRPDKERGWTYGSTRTEKARSPFYVAKYAQKGGKNEQGGHRFPKGLRIMACWASRRDADSDTARAFRVSTHPAWSRAIAADSGGPGHIRRAPGGGVTIDGQHFASPYALIEISRERPLGV